MAIRLRQSTASQEVPLGPFLDDTDGKTAETGLSIANTDIKLWKMGATTLADKNSGGATHISGGIYYCVLDATDTATLGALVIFISVSGALPVKVECEVVNANVYDSLIAGTDYLQVDAMQVEGVDATNQIRDAAQQADTLQRLVTLLEPAAGSSGEYRFSLDALRHMPTLIWGAERANYTVAGSFGQYVPANVTFFGGAAGTFSGGRPEVNTTHAAGTAWNSGAIGAATLATDTITAAKIAADAIGASELAADAIAEIQSGLATAAALTLVKATTDKLDTTLQAAGGSPGDYEFSADALRRAPTGSGGSAPSAAAIADAVWDEAISGHLTSGTTGAALNAAGSAGDPWSTTLPGAYGAGTAGYIIGQTMHDGAARLLTMVEVASGSPGDYKFTPDALRAVIGIVPTAVETADALLKRDWTLVTGEASRSMLNAGRFIRNGFSIAGSTLTVLKEDDTSAAYTRDLTTDAAADPITGVS